MAFQPNCTVYNAIDLPSTFTWSVTEKAIILIFLPLVTFFGNVGNLAFLYTGLRVPRMRTVANMYLFSLAISDVLFLSIVCGLYMWNNATSPVIRTDIYNSPIGCWLSFIPATLCYYASLQMVTLVSFERYYAICQPMKHLSFTGKQRTKKQIVICWIIAIALAVLSTFKWGDLQKLTFCVGSLAGEKLLKPRFITLKWCEASFALHWFTIIGEGIANTLFLLAMISSGFTYVKIIQALSKREDTNLQSNQDKTNKDVRRQVAKTLIANGIIFFACQIPQQVLRIHSLTDVFDTWSLHHYSKSQLIAISRICLYLNSAINPYVYIAGSKYYRQAFMEAFGFRSSHAKTETQTSIAVSVIQADP